MELERRFSHLREELCELIEPSDVFLFKLVRKGILLDRQFDKILCKETVYEQNDQLLTYLLDESFVGDYTAVLDVLKETGQEHVVNFITSKGGLYSQLLTYLLNYQQHWYRQQLKGFFIGGIADINFKTMVLFAFSQRTQCIPSFSLQSLQLAHITHT